MNITRREILADFQNCYSTVNATSPTSISKINREKITEILRRNLSHTLAEHLAKELPTKWVEGNYFEDIHSMECWILSDAQMDRLIRKCIDAGRLMEARKYDMRSL